MIDARLIIEATELTESRSLPSPQSLHALLGDSSLSELWALTLRLCWPSATLPCLLWDGVARGVALGVVGLEMVGVVLGGDFAAGT